MQKNYDELSDETLVTLSRAGDGLAGDALCVRYKNMVRIKSRPYFLMGGDREDLLQEGMIGLYKAMRDYQSEQASFRTFAEMCVQRQIITAVKTATRQKHQPLNSYVSLYRDEDAALIDSLRLEGEDPADAYMGKERNADLRKLLAGALSPLERQVLTLFLEGRSYKEIATLLGRGTKCVDNALQRIKKKMEGYLQEA